ncbi:hypothetical protein GCM10023208_10540 [Erythrobacter westpacificensis]|uniref:Uncharacterized protein n=1 Tax=Erythrobacter westpacificensis TaxID=1055231 RepID=A0ABP9K744_9SPHN
MTRKPPSKSPVSKRLDGYWKLEVANAALIPAFVVAMSHIYGEGAGWLTWLALFPTAGLLLVGGLYWRGKLRALEGSERALDAALRLADKAQWPSLVLSLLSVSLVLADLLIGLPGVTGTDRWAAGGSGILALLEYVNYYHRQLQHFDNASDFKRLLTGRGMRPAKMAVDLAAWRGD